VAELVGRGLSNREIAAELHLAEGTVKNHISALLRKTQVPDRTRLALHFHT
jgi:luxR family two component transcriptional regulator